MPKDSDTKASAHERRRKAGAYMRGQMKARNISSDELSRKSGVDVGIINRCAAGRRKIDEQIARSLADYVSESVEFWVALEINIEKILNNINNIGMNDVPDPPKNITKDDKLEARDVLERLGSIRGMFATVSHSGRIVLFRVDEDPKTISRILSSLDNG